MEHKFVKVILKRQNGYLVIKSLVDIYILECTKQNNKGPICKHRPFVV